MIATLERIDRINDTVKMFWFRPERRMHYTAGQFTELYLPHENPDDRGERRWFTLSSSPSEDLLAITTRFAGEKSSTFKKKLFNLPIGTKVTLADPMGDFVLPKDKTIPLLFVSIGMGVTPVRSMIKWLTDTGEHRNIRLLHAVRTEPELIFRRLFEAYDMEFTPILKEPSASWEGETGLLTADRVSRALDTPKTLVYLCGPEDFTEAITDETVKHGVAKHRVVTDFFPGYSQN